MDHKEIYCIQALRAIAALLVVFCHCDQFTTTFVATHFVEKLVGRIYGGFGVDVFFVISGFIMVYITKNNFAKGSKALVFFARRLIRIFPLYWFILLFVVFILVPTGIYAYAFPWPILFEKSRLVSPSYWLENLFLLHGPKMIWVAWTLVYEMFFYYIFTILLFFKRKYYLISLSIVFMSLTLAALLINIPHFKNIVEHSYGLQLLEFFGNNIILEFLLGCFIAEEYLSGGVLSKKVAILTVILSGFWLLFPWEFSPYTTLQHGIPAMFLLYALLSLEATQHIKIPALLIKLGDASYSIYLSHGIFLVVIMAILKKYTLTHYIYSDFIIVIAFSFCVFMGYGVYKFIEAPLLGKIKRVIF